MNTQIIALTANRDYFIPLITLGRTYYPANHPVLTEQFLKWLYLDNPAGPATLIVAQEEELWIGLIALIPIWLEHSSGQVQKACYAVNVLTHPEHRTKNLFVKMIRHARDVLSADDIWLLGHPNANAVPGWKRQKMEFRDSMYLHLARFNRPFSSTYTNRIDSAKQLLAISSDFWDGAIDRGDVHIKYTPEFIIWRFLSAPHRKYVVSTVYRRGELLGLRVTRPVRGLFNLMVDFVSPAAQLGDLLSSVRIPTIVVHSGCGKTGADIRKGCWKLPTKRQFPFFATTWGEQNVVDMAGITLGASDF